MVSYAKYGQTRQTTVKSYKRGKQGRSKKGRFRRKTVVSEHTRTVRNWGPATGIPLQPIIKYERRPSVNFRGKITQIPRGFFVPPRFYEHFGMDPDKAEDKFIQYYNLIPQIIKDGIKKGIQIFSDNFLMRIPSNTGNLRRQLFRSISYYKSRFPVTIKWGAPRVKYASVVNRYTPSEIQIEHRAGLQYSGVKRKYLYNAGTGDPKAVYHFFDKGTVFLRESIKKGVLLTVDQYKMPRSIFYWLVKITERLT